MLVRPSISEIRERVQADIETRLTGIGSLLRRSVLKVLAVVVSGIAHLIYGYIDYQAQQIFASTASENSLEVMANEWGISKSAATYASGSGTATGTAGTIIPSGSSLQNSDGYIYLTDEAYTIGAGLSVTISFTSKYAGADYNEDAGVSLTFVSPITGVNSSVTIDSDGVTGGSDSEENDELREKILTRKRLPPHGGTDDDYVAWMKEVSGVTRAWCFSQFNGNGTVGLAFVYDNNSTVLPDSDNADDMLDYIEEHIDPVSGETVGAPLGALPGIFIMSSSGMVSSGSVDSSYVFAEDPVTLTIQLYPNTATVQEAVLDEIEAIILSDGGPGQTLRLSRISEAIGNAVGEEYHKIVSPTTDITASYNELPTFDSGYITFQDYT